MAAVIKYGDNILKNFTTACSVILGTFISVVFFGYTLTFQFVFGATLVVVSAYAYVTAPEPAPAAVMVAPDVDGGADNEHTDTETQTLMGQRSPNNSPRIGPS